MRNGRLIMTCHSTTTPRQEHTRTAGSDAALIKIDRQLQNTQFATASAAASAADTQQCLRRTALVQRAPCWMLFCGTPTQLHVLIRSTAAKGRAHSARQDPPPPATHSPHGPVCPAQWHTACVTSSLLSADCPGSACGTRWDPRSGQTWTQNTVAYACIYKL
jgi:hypothetical protein